MKKLLPIIAITFSMASASSWYSEIDTKSAEEIWQNIQTQESESNKTKASIILNNVTKANTTAAKNSLKKFNAITNSISKEDRSKALVKSIFQKIANTNTNDSEGLEEESASAKITLNTATTFSDILNIGSADFSEDEFISTPDGVTWLPPAPGSNVWSGKELVISTDNMNHISFEITVPEQTDSAIGFLGITQENPDGTNKFLFGFIDAWASNSEGMSVLKNDEQLYGEGGGSAAYGKTYTYTGTIPYPGKPIKIRFERFGGYSVQNFYLKNFLLEKIQ